MPTPDGPRPRRRTVAVSSLCLHSVIAYARHVIVIPAQAGIQRRTVFVTFCHIHFAYNVSRIA